MGKRASKPTQLKVIEGNPGKRPLPTREPKPAPIAPKCPVDIDKNAKATWKKLAPMLERMNLISEVDGYSLSDLCQIRSRIVEVRKEIDRLKRLGVEDHVQDLKPYYVAERALYDQYRKYAADFGLSPRHRVGLVVNTGDDNEGQDLLT